MASSFLSTQSGSGSQKRFFPSNQKYSVQVSVTRKDEGGCLITIRLELSYRPCFENLNYSYTTIYTDPHLSEEGVTALENDILPLFAAKFAHVFLNTIITESPDVQRIFDRFLTEYGPDFQAVAHLITFTLDHDSSNKEILESEAFDIDEDRIWKPDQRSGELNEPDVTYIQQLIDSSKQKSDHEYEHALEALSEILGTRLPEPNHANFFIIPVMHAADLEELLRAEPNDAMYWSANIRAKRGDVVLFYHGKSRTEKENPFRNCCDATWKPFFDHIRGSVFGTGRILTDIIADAERGYGGKWVFIGDVFIYNIPIDIFQLRDEFGSPVSNAVTKAGLFKPKFLPEGISFLSAFRKADAGQSPHIRNTGTYTIGDTGTDERCATSISKVPAEKFISEETVQAYFALPLLERVLPPGIPLKSNFSLPDAANISSSITAIGDEALFIPVFFRRDLPSLLTSIDLRPIEEAFLKASPRKAILLFSDGGLYKIAKPGKTMRTELLFTRRELSASCIEKFRSWLARYFAPDQLSQDAKGAISC